MTPRRPYLSDYFTDEELDDDLRKMRAERAAEGKGPYVESDAVLDRIAGIVIAAKRAARQRPARRDDGPGSNFRGRQPCTATAPGGEHGGHPRG
ncbi:MAG TPA: hypothetical protein VKB57_23800 [Acidimicrobiales bacterium]|nr:hypothetical protein [Acidimicrobiales bacterium]